MFLLSWQFGPFVLLCQLSCLMVLSRFLLLPASKVSMMVVVVAVSLLVNCVVQNKPPLLISSPALSMVVPALIISMTPSDGSLGAFLRFTIAAAEMSLVLLATVLISGAIKIFMNIDADSHVYQLLLAKFQVGDPRDFDSRLYMCTEAFDYMDLETVGRLCDSGLLFAYGLGILIYSISTLRVFLNNALEVTEDSETEKFFENRQKNLELSMNSEAFLFDQYEETEERKEAVNYEGGTFEDMTCDGKDMLEEDITQYSASLQCSTEQQIIKGRLDLVFFVGMSVMWNILAALIMRLKVLWMPTVCVIAGVVMADRQVCVALTQMLGVRAVKLPQWFPGGLKMVIALGYLLYLIQKFWGQLSSEIWPEEVYEFWDPDTVELMEWIQSYTPTTAVFAGSMQLLAGVKLCTKRHITNHPHYEDSWLRDRTHEIYKIYGCESPEIVYNTLKAAGATHIILEDSICLAPPDPRHPLCRLVDIVDLHSGHFPEGEVKNIPGLQACKHRRFCDAVRHRTKEYSRLFSLVMNNKTFRVYSLMVT
uniref:C-mannosyltransferase DPY19L3 n=1 Tax=Scylla olivacea TaxID=85551 RepID=A0A0P4VZH2_SCYOL